MADQKATDVQRRIIAEIKANGPVEMGMSGRWPYRNGESLMHLGRTTSATFDAMVRKNLVVKTSRRPSGNDPVFACETFVYIYSLPKIAD